MAKSDFVEVMEAIHLEREYQDEKHGPIDSHGHTIGEWILIAESELAEAKVAVIKGGVGRDAVKAELLQVAATIVAALEQHGMDPIEERAV